MSVDNSTKTVTVGKVKKDNFEKLQLERLIIHEFTHLEKYQRAEDLGLPAIIIKGTPKYLPFEEAFCVFLEECWIGKTKTDLYKYRYIAGSFAQGAIDGEYHDFRDCFNYVMGYAISLLKDTNLTKEKINELKKRYTM